jgi:D-3-phosphoglycerate dehydrogenase
MLLLISDAFDPSMPEKLSVFGEVTDNTERLAEADIVLVRSKTKCTREWIDAASNLKMIIRGGVGLDNIDIDYAKSKGVAVHNTPNAPAIAVAELTMAMMLAVPNRIVEADNSMQQGEWKKKQLKRTELYGKQLALFGIGNIATEVAKRASAFGMEVVAYDKYVKESKWARMVESPEEAVKEADYISLHLPLTDETEGMFNASLIAACGKKPVVLNAGRGAVVQADEMAAALKDGSVAYYATDVYPSDPPAEDYPIRTAPNTLMTPHIGASSKENLERIGDEAYGLIKDAIDGGKI